MRKKPGSLTTTNLPAWELVIESDALARLNANVFAKLPVSARLRAGGRQYRVLVAYAGKSTIDDYKKNLQITFPDTPWQGQTIVRLSALGTDPSGIRAQLAFDIFGSFAPVLPVPAARPVAVHLNRRYLGLYMEVEYIDQDFFRRRGIGIRSLYKAKFDNADFSEGNLRDPGSSWSVRMEPDDLRADLFYIIEKVVKLSDSEFESQIGNLLHVDNYLTYLAASVFMNNRDGYRNNLHLYREKETGRYGFVPWDLDKTFYAGPEYPYYPNESIWGESTVLQRRVLAVPALRQRYLEILQGILKEHWPITRFDELVQSRLNETSLGFATDRVLSSGGATAAAEADRILTFHQEWTGRLSAELEGLLPLRR